ncbi:MAG: hypothetical protein LUH55_14525 [Bacteroides thetaiotaomicron]|nr:hypothetical protein [Bacteroides thetaiotaomicron]
MWIIVALIVIGIIAYLGINNGIFGKLEIASVVLIVGCLLINWITGMSIFITLAQILGVIIVVLIIIQILIGIFTRE